jgi:hypothetical protein
LSRTKQPKTIFIWEKFTRDLSKDPSNEELHAFMEAREADKEARSKLEDFLQLLRENLGKSLKVTRIDSDQARKLEDGMFKLITRVIDEIVNTNGTPTPILEPLPMMERRASGTLFSIHAEYRK